MKSAMLAFQIISTLRRYSRALEFSTFYFTLGLFEKQTILVGHNLADGSALRE
jgi:hypothetical protein